MTATVQSWFGAQTFLAGGRRAKDDRPIENNTRVHKVGNNFAVKLHDTDVVTYFPDGTVELNSGGWRTMTTKARINAYLGDEKLRVWSDRGRWYVYAFVESAELVHVSDEHPDWDYHPIEHVKLGLFFDGIRIKDGKILNPMPEAKSARQIQREARIGKAIDKYVTAYMAALAKGMPVPGSGDCWGCYFRTGNTSGPVPDGMFSGHLESHLKERYYVPSLILVALIDKKYGDPRFVLGMSLQPEPLKAGTMKLRDQDRYSVQSLRRALRRYLRRKLLPSVASS